MLILTGKPIKGLPDELFTSFTSTASELYNQLALKSASSVHRLRVTKGSDGTLIPNSSEVSIQQTGLRDQSIIYVKDLGMAASSFFQIPARVHS